MINKFSTAGVLTFIACIATAQNNLSNTDSIIINSGQQTAEANLKHQQFCQSMGGTDVTDNGVITKSKQTGDVIACATPSNLAPKAATTTINHDWQGTLANPSGGLLPNPYVTAIIAPSGIIRFNTRAMVAAFATYHNPDQAIRVQETTDLAIPSDECYASYTGGVPAGDDTTVTVNAVCMAKVAGDVQSNTYACALINESLTLCQIATGLISQPDK